MQLPGYAWRNRLLALEERSEGSRSVEGAKRLKPPDQPPTHRRAPAGAARDTPDRESELLLSWGGRFWRPAGAHFISAWFPVVPVATTSTDRLPSAAPSGTSNRMARYLTRALRPPLQGRKIGPVDPRPLLGRTSPFTGPRQTTLISGPARPAAPCATDCYTRNQWVSPLFDILLFELFHRDISTSHPETIDREFDSLPFSVFAHNRRV